MNLENIYRPTSPYRSFNFQQLFFYDIFLANVYCTSDESSVVKVYVYTSHNTSNTTVLDRHKIQDSGHSNKWVLPYVLSKQSNEARLSRLAFNLCLVLEYGRDVV